MTTFLMILGILYFISNLIIAITSILTSKEDRIFTIIVLLIPFAFAFYALYVGIYKGMVQKIIGRDKKGDITNDNNDSQSN